VSWLSCSDGITLSALPAVPAAGCSALAPALQRLIIAGFPQQAVAPGTDHFSVVQPPLALEPPAALTTSAVLPGGRPGHREWQASAVTAAGVAGLITALGPGDGKTSSVSRTGRPIGCGANLSAIVAGVLWALGASGSRRATVLGATTGCTFELTAAPMNGTTDVFSHGPAALFASRQLWSMIAAGGCAMSLLESAMHAGPLPATRPGVTMADPVAAVPSGDIGQDETADPVRQGETEVPHARGG
jgi:hypothetical protein